MINSNANKHFLIISGIPGTGKSTYAEWLHHNYGFVHIDSDWKEPPSDDELQSNRVVVDWGFPANDPELSQALEIIELWKSRGAKLWWFDGDRQFALRSFLERGTIEKSAWNFQLRGIEKNWARISKTIGRNRINVVSSAGYLAHEAVFKKMFPEGIN